MLAGVLVLAASSTPVVEHSLTTLDWVVAGIILAVGIAAGRVIQAILARAVKRGDTEHQAADAFGRMIGLLVIIGAFIYCLSVLGVRLGPLVGALGIGGLAIAFAAQTILANFLASVILQLRRPFRRGDQVSSNDIEGTVEDINFRTVLIRTYEGERVYVPCAEVLSRPITNHTVLGRRRTTLKVGVSYECELETACQVLREAIAQVPGVLDKPPCEAWVTSFADSSVEIAIRYWHAPDAATLWKVRSAVAMAAKRALDGAGIDIPFPQITVHPATDRELESN
jgi:small conductance mechanosensitive channel